MFIAALFTIAKQWKWTRCPTTDEWIKEMWYLDTMGFSSATKKNKSSSFAGKWLELENFILSGVSQVQKEKGHVFSLICGILTQYKCKHYHIYIEMSTEHVFKSGACRGG
jgi:hypothetical protein